MRSALWPRCPWTSAVMMLATTDSTTTRIVHRDDQANQDSYIVHVSENKTPPDVDLRSSSGAIRSAIWSEGDVPRAVGVKVSSEHGWIDIAIPEKKLGTAWDVDIENTNGELLVKIASLLTGLKKLNKRKYGNITLNRPYTFSTPFCILWHAQTSD